MATETELERALGEAIAHLGADSGTLHLKRPGGLELELAASQGIPAPVLDVVRVIPWGKGMAGLAAERRQPVDACNIQTTASPDVRPGARATGLRGGIVVPLLLEDRVIGTLGVGCQAERAFTEQETGWLMDFGRTLARSLESKPA